MKKKRVLWTSVALIALSVSFLLIHKYSPHLTSMVLLLGRNDEGSVKSLQYIFYISRKGPKRGFSLKVDNSGSMDNHEVLNNLVGTLVKYDLDGHFFPYLAKGWTFSKDHKKWSFPLKPHLTFDNGDPITAEGFVSHLQEKLLWYYQKKGGALVV